MCSPPPFTTADAATPYHHPPPPNLRAARPGTGFFKMADVIDECPPLAKLFEGGFLEKRFQEIFQVKSQGAYPPPPFMRALLGCSPRGFHTPYGTTDAPPGCFVFFPRQLPAGFRHQQIPSAVLARSGAGTEVSEVRDAMSVGLTRKGTKGAAPAAAGANRGDDLAGDPREDARGGGRSASPRGGGSASPKRGGRRGTRGSGLRVEVGDNNWHHRGGGRLLWSVSCRRWGRVDFRD